MIAAFRSSEWNWQPQTAFAHFFEIINGHRLEDPAGIDLATDKEAVGLGKMIAAQIAAEVPAAVAKRHVAVIDHEGREVAKIKVGQP